MRVAFITLGFALGVAAAASGCKGDPVKCDQACRNVATLVFWKKADAEIAAALAGQRDAMRKAKLGRFDAEMERGIDMCVSQCESADNTEQIDCMVAARTSEQALACSK